MTGARANTRELAETGGPDPCTTSGFAAAAGRRGTIVVAFADPPDRSALGRRLAGPIEIFSDTPPGGALPWRALAPLRRSVPVDDTLDLLRNLNRLRGPDGLPYSETVRLGEVRSWWFHQQIAFDHYLEPFLAYQPLLEACASAERVLVFDCPDDLRPILPLLPFEIRTAERGGMRRALAPARRLTAGLYFGLMTLTAIALTKRRGLVVYGLDISDDAGRNPWLSGLYDAMAREGCRFSELVWSKGGAHAAQQWFRRRRPVIHLQAVVPRPPAAPAGAGAETRASGDLTMSFLHALAERVLLARSRWSLHAIRRIERLLALLRPAGALVMDDYVHGFELLSACRRRGIPTVAVQHGQVGCDSVGLMAPGYVGPPLFADRYCVWTDRFRRLLTKESAMIAADSIRVGGLPRTTEREAEKAEKIQQADNGSGDGDDRQENGVRVLFLAEQYDTFTLEREVAPFLRALRRSFPEMRIRPHPARPTASEILRLAEQDDSSAGFPGGHDLDRGDMVRDAAPSCISTGTLAREFARTDVVVGSFSSALLEAIHASIPVVLFETVRHADPHGLAADGLADLATTPDELAPLARVAARLPPRERHRRRDELWGRQPADGGQAALRILRDLGGR